MMKRSLPILFSAIGLLMQAACTGPEKPSAPDPAELRSIAAEQRLAELRTRAVLRVAVSTNGGKAAYLSQQGTFEGPEVEKIRETARKKGWRIFLFAVRPEALEATVRSGRADLAIGGLEAEKIRESLLTPLMEYQENGKTFAFAAWSGAEELKDELEK